MYEKYILTRDHKIYEYKHVTNLIPNKMKIENKKINIKSKLTKIR